MTDKERSVRETQGQQRQTPPPVADEDRELEQYGVWVKAGPEDYNEPQGSEEEVSLSDLEESSSIESLDNIITDEEEELLSNLEEPADLPDVGDYDVGDFETADFADDELSGLDSFDQNGKSGSEMFDEELPDIPEEDIADVELSDDDLSLDIEEEALRTLDQPEEGSLHTEYLAPQTEELLMPEGEGTGSDETSFDDLDLLGDSADEFDLAGLETEETENLVDSLPDLDLGDEDSNHGAPEMDIDDFDDVRAVEDEMSSASDDEFQMDIEEKPSRDSGADSLSVLHTIEDELQSIKKELSQLKAELSSLRGQPQQSIAAAPGQTVDQRAGEPSGFFEEEEDETIALTGDELDNILNTAEFTEETGKPTEIEDYLESLPQSDEEPSEDLLEELDVEEIEEEPQSVDEQVILDEDDLLRGTGLESTLYEDAEVPEEELPIEEITLEDELNEAELEEEIFDDFEEELQAEEPEELSPAHEDSESREELAPLDDTEAVNELSLEDEISLGDDELDIDIELPSDEALPELDGDSPEAALISEELSEELPAGTETADDSEVDALAQMDIESELAEIEELDDETDDEFDLATADLDIDLSLADETEEEIVLDDVGEESGLEIEPETEDFLDEVDMEEELETLEDASEVEEFEIPELLAEDDALSVPDLKQEEEIEEIEEFEEIEEVEEIAEAYDQDRSGHDSSTAIPGATRKRDGEMAPDLQDEIKTVLRYMDQLLEALPEDKIQEFARSEHFVVYKRLFEELGLEQ